MAVMNTCAFAAAHADALYAVPIPPPRPASHASAGPEDPARECMKSWMSQIVIGVIVTVVGTVIADAILQGGKGRKRFFSESHFSGLPRAGR